MTLSKRFLGAALAGSLVLCMAALSAFANNAIAPVQYVLKKQPTIVVKTITVGDKTNKLTLDGAPVVSEKIKDYIDLSYGINSMQYGAYSTKDTAKKDAGIPVKDYTVSDNGVITFQPNNFEWIVSHEAVNTSSQSSSSSSSASSINTNSPGASSSSSSSSTPTIQIKETTFCNAVVNIDVKAELSSTPGATPLEIIRDGYGYREDMAVGVDGTEDDYVEGDGEVDQNGKLVFPIATSLNRKTVDFDMTMGDVKEDLSGKNITATAIDPLTNAEHKVNGKISKNNKIAFLGENALRSGLEYVFSLDCGKALGFETDTVYYNKTYTAPVSEKICVLEVEKANLTEYAPVEVMVNISGNLNKKAGFTVTFTDTITSETVTKTVEGKAKTNGTPFWSGSFSNIDGLKRGTDYVISFDLGNEFEFKNDTVYYNKTYTVPKSGPAPELALDREDLAATNPTVASK